MWVAPAFLFLLKVSEKNQIWQQDCESFAGPITSNLADCTADSSSCSAYVLDDCTYTGERLGKWRKSFLNSGIAWRWQQISPPDYLEPPPGNVASIEDCRLWAEVLVDGGLNDVAFFHFDSDIDECHLYSIMVATCQSVGGPRTAPPYDQCSQLANWFCRKRTSIFTLIPNTWFTKHCFILVTVSMNHMATLSSANF